MYSILNERVVIAVTGEDRLKFLQGLISNDLNKLEENNAIYACMLTPQGKYFADFFLKKEQDKILIDIPKLRKEEIKNKLNVYKLRSLISIEDTPYKVISFLTDDIKKIIHNNIIFQDPRSNKMGLRCFTTDSLLGELSKNLKYNQDAYDLARIDNFIAEGEKDLIPGKSFLLEYGLDGLNAIDYKKGCYVGQELVARMHYQGVIRKQITQIHSKIDLPELGTLIYADQQKIGSLCSSIKNKGLALIRTENVVNLPESSKITIEGQEVKLKFQENP